MEQVRQGHSVEVLSHWDRPGKKATQEEVDGVRVIRIPIWGHVAHAPIAPFFPRALYGIFSKGAPDVIHVHMPNLSPMCMLLSARKAPVVVHWHADVFTSFASLTLTLLYPGYAFFQKLFLRKAAAVVVTSHAYRQASKPLQPFEHKTVTIPLALDPARMSQVTGRQGADFGNPTVISVGRFTYYKGFDILVKAASHLPEHVQVVIVGDGPLRPKIQDLTVQLKLEQRVLLPGRLSDQRLHALMAQSSVFCLPSIERTEAFGLVLLEAMYYALPLVSTRMWGSGMQLVNEHGVTGLCVDPGDELALAGALMTLLDNPNLALSMGEAGRKRVDEEFHITRLVQDLTRLYASL